MSKYNPAQLKALSEFLNMVAAAWFAAGIISPFFTRPGVFIDLFVYFAIGLIMTWATLRLSLYIVKGA